jgi:dihydroorotase
VLSAGAPADVTIIDSDLVWSVDATGLCSKSRNTPFIGWEMTGRATWTIVGGRVKWHQEGATTTPRGKRSSPR